MRPIVRRNAGKKEHRLLLVRPDLRAGQQMETTIDEQGNDERLR
jgi:hypothetical protein